MCDIRTRDAALARLAADKSVVLKESAKNQGSVAAQRAKKKAEAGVLDHSLQLQGGDTDLQVVVPFPIGKLGMSLERNCVSAVTGEPAEQLGVKKGWVLLQVNGTDVPKKKEAIAKLIMQVFKEQKIGEVEFVFSAPSMEGFSYCRACDKFVKDEDYNASQLEEGPGKQMCYSCEEFYG